MTKSSSMIQRMKNGVVRENERNLLRVVQKFPTMSPCPSSLTIILLKLKQNLQKI